MKFGGHACTLYTLSPVTVYELPRCKFIALFIFVVTLTPSHLEQNPASQLIEMNNLEKADVTIDAPTNTDSCILSGTSANIAGITVTPPTRRPTVELMQTAGGTAPLKEIAEVHCATQDAVDEGIVAVSLTSSEEEGLDSVPELEDNLERGKSLSTDSLPRCNHNLDPELNKLCEPHIVSAGDKGACSYLLFFNHPICNRLHS